MLISALGASHHSVLPRATGAPLAWMAAVGWMGNREPLAPLGST